MDDDEDRVRTPHPLLDAARARWARQARCAPVIDAGDERADP